MVLENFRAGTLERWGLGYEELAADNPGLIMIRVSGYGQTGPYASRAGYAAVGEAMGGMRYLCGEARSATEQGRAIRRRHPGRDVRVHGCARRIAPSRAYR